TTSSLPVVAATPVPAAPPAAVPISAPLPPPARPPINAPAAAPPPILVTLLLVWPLPLKVCDPVATACPFTSARRIESKPGACSRPLCLTPVTRHFAGSPTLANFFPCKTTSRATEQGIVLPALALLEDRVAPVRTVTFVPAGSVVALSDIANANTVARFKAILPFISPPEIVIDASGWSP